jgi:hypothetical protein
MGIQRELRTTSDVDSLDDPVYTQKDVGFHFIRDITWEIV